MPADAPPLRIACRRGGLFGHCGYAGRTPRTLLPALGDSRQRPPARGREWISPHSTRKRTLAGAARPQGGILAALWRSPLLGADLDLHRPRTQGRKVELWPIVCSTATFRFASPADWSRHMGGARSPTPIAMRARPSPEVTSSGITVNDTKNLSGFAPSPRRTPPPRPLRYPTAGYPSPRDSLNRHLSVASGDSAQRFARRPLA